MLYSFTGGSDGGYPAYGSLIMDNNGNLYGTTELDGHDAGTVYRLAPDGTETVLHYFSEGSDGFGPEALVMDKKGNLWGTACCGGNANGCGVIFKITTNGNEKLVHTFAGPPGDGCGPDAALITDQSGNFYGTTPYGGEHRGGAVFKLAPDGSETLMFSFNLKGDGFFPFAGLIIDENENLFGAAVYGGAKDLGTVFEIAPDGTETVLHVFKRPAKQGSNPDGVIMDQAGNLYGTASSGGLAGCYGDTGCGVVFKLAPDGTEAVLHFFTGKKGDGSNPLGDLIADGA
ncbi:MAG TPA: choice-of-anchor tandem repeat GloVer-containing protein, partial [Rhizomicrobium sp.]